MNWTLSGDLRKEASVPHRVCPGTILGGEDPSVTPSPPKQLGEVFVFGKQNLGLNQVNHFYESLLGLVR